MLKRYSRKELRDIWSGHSKYQTWLEVELHATEAYAKFNKKNHQKGYCQSVKKSKN